MHRELERRHFAQRLTERIHRLRNELLASCGRRRRRIADVSIRSEIVRQPAEPNRTAEADIPVVGKLLRDVAGGDRHVDQMRSEVQHHRRLVGTPVDAHAQLVGRRHAALVGWHARVSEERHQAVGQPNLAVGDPDERRIAAVTVEEHELARRRGGHAATDVVEHRQQRGGRQPDGARRPGVLIRLRVREGRQQPHVEFFADALDRQLRDPVGDEQIGVERQVRAVLLDRTERLHEDAPLGDALARCRGLGVR